MRLIGRQAWRSLPQLVQFLLVNAAVGALLGAAFAGLLLLWNVAGLRTVIAVGRVKLS
jgi:hypothetical protein